jgi:HEPN domain-containing protein
MRFLVDPDLMAASTFSFDFGAWCTREELLVTRSEWRRTAESRVRDAAALLKARRYSAAYYLAGYAIECALKACIVAYLKKNLAVIFQDRRFSEKCWTHDFKELLRLAGLRARWDADIDANPALRDNGEIVQNWNETARYQRKSRAEAEGLYQAITDPAHGVLPWIRNHW